MKSTDARFAFFLGFICLLVRPGFAQTAQSEVESIRKEMEQLRRDYEKRLEILDQRLKKLEPAQTAAIQTNVFPAGTRTNGVMALTNAASANRDATLPFRRDTETRERSISQQRDRMIRERMEHVLTEFVDIEGYFRAGFGRDNVGGPQPPFQAPGALAKYRLGNETENYGELIAGKNWFPTNYFVAQPNGPLDTSTNGPIARTQLRLAFFDPYANYGSGDTFQTTLPEVWAEVGDVVPGQPSLKFWAGNRFYRRHDIHIMDFYFLNMSGGGGGFEDLQVPFGKMAVAWLGSAQQSSIFRDLQQPDTVNKAGFSKQNVDLSLYDITMPLGKGEFALVYANEGGGRDANGRRAPNSDGGALTFIHTHEKFIDENGFNKFSLQLGFGAAKTFTSGFETLATAAGNFIDADDPHSWRFRATEQFVVQPSEHFSIGPAFVYQYTDYRDFLGQRHWLSSGVRPIIHFTKHFSLAFEGGVDYV
ncbi:MAG: hypothetical protein JWM16_2355, partial [Verrucomicrobiales bacterium]|nr:hypothetical protein [Verrucomicrobiales bacterium]